jgi:hypothetical protein
MTVIVDYSTAEQYKALKDLVSSARSSLSTFYTASANGRTSQLLLNDYIVMGSFRDRIDAAATTEVTNYADTVEAAGYDAASQYAGLVSALTSVLAWVDAHFPASNGYILAATISDGQLTWRNFDGNALSGYRTELQTVINLIEPN